MEFNSLSEVKNVYEEEENLGAFDDFLYSAVGYIFTNGYYEKYFDAEYPFVDGHEAVNLCYYNDLQESTIDDFAKWMSYNANDDTDFVKEYEYSIYTTTSIEDLVDFSQNCLYELIDAVDDDFDDTFQRAKKKYLDYFERYLGGNQYKKVQDTDTNDKIENGKELHDIKDDIGDRHNIQFGYDFEDRDYAFIYLDGEIIKGKSGQTHAQILENYMKQIDKEEDIPEDYKEDGGNIDGSRPSTYRLKRLVNTENNAYGNVIDNVALIEVLENVSEQEVANVCKKQLKVDKVYMVSRNSKTDVVKRLAKIIRMDV